MDDYPWSRLTTAHLVHPTGLGRGWRGGLLSMLVVAIAVPAFLSTQGVDADRKDQGELRAYHPTDWDEPRACEVGSTPLWAANLTDLGPPL